MEETTAALTDVAALALIAKTLQYPVAEIKLDDEIAHLCADSIQQFELLTAFENELKQTFDYEEVVELKTVQNILDYLHRIEIRK